MKINEGTESFADHDDDEDLDESPGVLGHSRVSTLLAKHRKVLSQT